MDNLKVGSFLQALRKAKGLTQSDVADYFEISNKTVSKWECGSALPEIPMLKALAEYYDVTVDEILNGAKAVKNEEVSEKKKKDNENYFISQKMKKLDFWMLISYLVLALGFVFIYILGYTTKRADIATFVSIGIYFVSLAIYFIGKYMIGNISEDFSEDKIKKLNDRKYMHTSIYFTSLVYSAIMSIIFYLIPKSETDIIKAVPNIGLFLGINLVGLLVSALVIGLILYAKETSINKKIYKIININHIGAVFILTLIGNTITSVSHYLYSSNNHIGVHVDLSYGDIPYIGRLMFLILILSVITEIILYFKKPKLTIIPKIIIMICFVTILIYLNYEFDPNKLVQMQDLDISTDINNFRYMETNKTMVYYLTSFFTIIMLPLYFTFDFIHYKKSNKKIPE